MTVLALLFALLPMCPAEDSTSCAWHADTQGNGAGVSFVSVAGVSFPIERNER